MSVVTINAKIDSDTKKAARSVLNSLGLNMSEAITLFFKQVIYQRGIPFELKVPNKVTLRAIKELDSGKGTSFDSVDELLKDL
ncbi:MAG: type II toxin-antitoxin system RelB/DinJ family antitoxin [Planctomycetes bacterium]|nr:type II toxin-antitoxin system RelB/DinJ family antitoxin [Planctomycetota bacterium]